MDRQPRHPSDPALARNAPAAKVSLAQVEKEGLQLLSPLQRQVKALTITDEPSYLQADLLLGRVIDARRLWASKLSPIITPLKRAIDAAKEAMGGAKHLDAEVDGPLEKMETGVKGLMRTYKIGEQRRIEEADRIRKREQARLDQEQRDLQRKLDAAKTAPVKAKIEAAQEKLTKQAETIEQERPVPIVAAMSTTRTTPTWRVVDFYAMVKGVAAGAIPRDALVVDKGAVNRYFKDNPAAVFTWPGLELYDEVTIVRR